MAYGTMWTENDVQQDRSLISQVVWLLSGGGKITVFNAIHQMEELFNTAI